MTDSRSTKPEPIYTLEEARKLLKISRQTLTRLIGDGRIGYYPVGARKYIRASDIAAYQTKHQRLPA